MATLPLISAWNVVSVSMGTTLVPNESRPAEKMWLVGGGIGQDQDKCLCVVDAGYAFEGWKGRNRRPTEPGPVAQPSPGLRRVRCAGDFAFGIGGPRREHLPGGF